MNTVALLLTAVVAALPIPDAAPQPPGQPYAPPERPTAAGAPLIYSFTEEAGPDQTFLLVGEGLSEKDGIVAWGASPDAPGGQELKPKIQFVRHGTLAATLPERAYDGPIVVWAKNEAGYSDPVVLNAPNPWWCIADGAEEARPGSVLAVFGRNLARRPDFSRAFAFLARPGKPGRWLPVADANKYTLRVKLPDDLAAGDYQLWFHAGKGGDFGWGGPLTVSVSLRPDKETPRTVEYQGGDLQTLVDQLGQQGGGVLKLPAGTFQLRGTLVVPERVAVVGAEGTVLQAPDDLAAIFPSVTGSVWNQGPGAIHSAGDRMAYKVAFPAAGNWKVWLRYATDMKPWNQPGVSGRMTLAVDGGNAVSLEDLENTGSFGTFRWSRSASMEISAGTHEIVWTNVKGGGINLDAVVFALDDAFQPSDKPWPASGERVVVVQAEDVARFETKEGKLPNADRAAVWLAGDHARLESLTILGSPQTNLGIVVRSPKYPQWIRGCKVRGVVVRDVEGKQAENCGIRLYHAEHAELQRNEFRGRAPIFLSGLQDSLILNNRLISWTLWGGNSESYLLSRNETLRRCAICENVFACPPGYQGGGPTGRRMIWVSTGRGSVDHNAFVGNREERARFGGVAGTDQNVGEMILFEACERIAYHGRLVAADAESVTLPEKLPPTPDDRLGSVDRKNLAYDADGNETPFWPPETDQNDGEPISTEYFVTILRGRGLGQTRRVAGREGATYRLERAWRVAPEADSLVVVHTAYYRNHLINNRAVDGMTGIQLWISCIENVLSGNEILRQRKPALYLYGNCSTLASSMPTTWNRGIGPLYFNHIEGTRASETSCGALVVSGDSPDLPIEFPRCLGNVLRHNSFERSRTDGVLMTGGQGKGERSSPSVLGTICEFNIVRDARNGYHVAPAADGAVLRRNHAYFWYPVSNAPEKPIGFRVDEEGAAAALELNTVEGIQGGSDASVVETQIGPAKP